MKRIPGRNLRIANLPPTLGQARKVHTEPNHFKIGYVDRVVDGDSVWLWIDLDFDGIHAHRNCRLLGIDAPDKQPAKEASRAWLVERLAGLRTVNLYVPAIDKYGRPLVGIYTDEGGPSLNVQAIAAGMAVPYDGGPRAEVEYAI